MAASIVRPRRLLVGVFVACVLAAALVVATAPPPASAALAQAVLVVRAAGDHDALWLLDPATGTPTAAGELPGRAAAVAVSPDDSSIAYLPSSSAPSVWVRGSLGLKTISLKPAGVHRVDSLTWVDDHRLIVSGATRASADYFLDRLYLVNVTTGRTSWFRRLSGVEPYGVPALGKVVYTTYTVLKAGTAANNYARTVREGVRVVRLSKGTGTLITSETYKTGLDHRSFSRPQLSDDGHWFLTGQTGSDVSVTYTLLNRWGTPQFNVFTAALDVKGGWNAAGLIAFAGALPASGGDEPCVWVCDPVRSTIACTTSGLFPEGMMTGLDWSAGGDLVAGAMSFAAASPARHVYVIPGSLTSATDLGSGRLPVWVTP